MKVQSPTRVDLAGGTLDCWPLYSFVDQNCYTINMAIDIWTEAEVELLEAPEVKVCIEDLAFQKTYQNLEEFYHSSDKEISLLKEPVQYWNPSQGLLIRTRSQSPVGGGLGGSSSLTISLLKAFSHLFNKKMGLLEMVTLASNMEARLLKTPTGTQDYIPPIQGGLNVIRYGWDGVSVHTLDVPSNFMNQHMTLVYTGVSHHSGINNWHVIKSVVEGDSKMFEQLKELSQISKDLKTCIEKQEWDFQQWASLFEREYEVRSQLSPTFICEEIRQLKTLVLQEGGQAVKICGAGGGGCVMVWHAPEKKERIKQACQKRGFQVLNAQFVAPLS
ncbi:MAG: galactokinase [Bdellovibrio sp.]|nr:MAG: galactokinase [Bdellovibrio sp.]